MRVFRAKSALLQQESHQENGAAGPAGRIRVPFSLLGSKAVRFFDASIMSGIELKATRFVT